MIMRRRNSQEERGRGRSARVANSKESLQLGFMIITNGSSHSRKLKFPLQTLPSSRGIGPGVLRGQSFEKK